MTCETGDHSFNIPEDTTIPGGDDVIDRVIGNVGAVASGGAVINYSIDDNQEIFSINSDGIVNTFYSLYYIVCMLLRLLIQLLIQLIIILLLLIYV